MDASAPIGRTEFKVYYEDTDSLGVVYYANYLRYLERGRTDLFDSGPRSIAEYNAAGILVAVSAINVRFMAPARLGDRCVVVTRARRASPYRVRMQQEIWRQETQLLSADVDLVCVDREFALQEFPEEVLSRLAPTE